MSVTPAALPPLIEARCPECNALLFKARLPPGTWIEIYCKRCPAPKKEPIVIERKAA